LCESNSEIRLWLKVISQLLGCLQLSMGESLGTIAWNGLNRV